MAESSHEVSVHCRGASTAFVSFGGDSHAEHEGTEGSMQLCCSTLAQSSGTQRARPLLVAQNSPAVQLSHPPPSDRLV